MPGTYRDKTVRKMQHWAILWPLSNRIFQQSLGGREEGNIDQDIFKVLVERPSSLQNNRKSVHVHLMGSVSS